MFLGSSPTDRHYGSVSHVAQSWQWGPATRFHMTPAECAAGRASMPGFTLLPLFDATHLFTQMNRCLLRIHVMKAAHRHDPDVSAVMKSLHQLGERMGTLLENYEPVLSRSVTINETLNANCDDDDYQFEASKGLGKGGKDKGTVPNPGSASIPIPRLRSIPSTSSLSFMPTLSSRDSIQSRSHPYGRCVLTCWERAR